MCASLLGIVGAILSVLVAAIVQVAFDEAFVARRERRLNARGKAHSYAASTNAELQTCR